MALFNLLLGRFPICDLDGEWEKHLPSPYVPLTDNTGHYNLDWQKRWDQNLGTMRAENLTTEKSHTAVFLTPLSPRMMYGLTLAMKLIGSIASLVARHRGQFFIFGQETSNTMPHDGGETVHLLNGKYYRTSQRQYHQNLQSIDHGSTQMTIPVTVKDWRVAPEDSHLNLVDCDQVMRDLAAALSKHLTRR